MDQTISLTTLADAVNLSEDTLNTYVTCGILRGEKRDGDIFLSLSEIQTIFGDIAVSRIAVRPAAPTTKSEDKSTGEPTAAVEPIPEPETTVTEQVEAKTVEPAISTPAQVVTPEPSPELLSIASSLREQIEQLRQERDWLRSRIEHLESRSDRDQMLILSQSENVRKLIISPSRKSWRTLLPWSKDSQ